MKIFVSATRRMKIWYEDEGDRTTGIDMGCIDLLRIMHMSRLTPHKTGDTPGMADELFGKERNLYERHNRRRKDYSAPFASPLNTCSVEVTGNETLFISIVHLLNRSS